MHAQRFKDHLAGQLLERLAVEGFQRLAQRDVAHAAVNRGFARLVLQLAFQNGTQSLIRRFQRQIQTDFGLDAGCVGQKVEDVDLFFVLRHIFEEAFKRVVERNVARLQRLEGYHRRAENLGKGSHVVSRFFCNVGPVFRDFSDAGKCVYVLSVPARRDSAGIGTLLESLFKQGVQ